MTRTMPKTRRAFMRRTHLRSLRPWWRRFKANGYRVDRCEECGHRFRWSRDSRHTFGNDDQRTWHEPCISLVIQRGKAAERLEVLGVMVELTGITGADVRETMSMRAGDGPEGKATSSAGSNAWNRGWRVFYDLEKSQPTTEPTP